MIYDEFLISVREGFETVITVDTLTWRDPYWEFDHPSMVLAPVIRCKEDASGHERLVEDLCIDAAVGGVMRSQNFKETWGWRGYSLPYLKRAFRESLRGKTFPERRYSAQRTRITFYRDKGGDVQWRDEIL